MWKPHADGGKRANQNFLSLIGRQRSHTADVIKACGSIPRLRARFRSSADRTFGMGTPSEITVIWPGGSPEASTADATCCDTATIRAVAR